jgi:hypothetical protein
MTDKSEAISKPRHRHERNSWLICGGHIEWCYQCGAWRNLRHVKQNILVAASKWHRPSGIGGPNPTLKESAHD